MKKFVLTLAIAAIAEITAVAQETYQFPGWSCRDVTVIQQQLTLATENYQKIMIVYLLDIAKNGEPATFADACARIDAAIDAVDIKTTAVDRTDIKKQSTHMVPAFRPDLVAFSKANPSSYDFYFAVWGIMGNEPEFVYQTLTESLLKRNYSASYVAQAINVINRQAIALGKTDAEVLDLLKKLNRVFSAKLIEDKEAWGGVVAQIRTMMETYK